MILGLGIDTVEVKRIAQSISSYGDNFTHRLFTEAERSYAQTKANSAERFAARFAAKEAALKALGTGLASGIHWTELEVENDETGKPSLRLHGTAQELATKLGVRRTWLSLTHTSELASAIVIFED